MRNDTVWGIYPLGFHHAHADTIVIARSASLAG